LPVIVNTATMREPRAFAPDLPDRFRIDARLVAGETVAPPALGPAVLPVLVVDPVDAPDWPDVPPVDAVVPEPVGAGDVLEELVLDGDDDPVPAADDDPAPAADDDDEPVPAGAAGLAPPVGVDAGVVPVVGVAAVDGCPGPGPRAMAT
jgi:hypothetical protein